MPEAQITEASGEAVLTKCRLIGSVFAPQRGAEPQAFDWRDLCETLAPHGSEDAHRLLRQAQPGAFLGLCRARNNSQKVVTFFMLNPDKSGDAQRKLQLDPSFSERLLSVWRVESVKWRGVGLVEQEAA